MIALDGVAVAEGTYYTGSMSIQAFRNALDALVQTTERQSVQNPRRARPNMPLRFSKSGEVIADTPEELVQYQMLMRGAPVPPPVQARAPKKEARVVKKEARAPRQERFEKTHKVSKRDDDEPREVKDPSAAPSWSQGNTIGIAIGGFERYCPSMARDLHAAKESHAQVLAAMGLTRGRASEVVQALKDAGVNLYGANRTPQSIALAQKILTEVGGVQCPSRYNPRRRR